MKAHLAKKSLGQHFLKYPEIAERIVRLLRPASNEQVLEIGPGPGALTDHLRALPLSCLRLLEKDSYYASQHNAIPFIAKGAETPTDPTSIEVCHGDALVYPWESLSGPWKIIGNLPYNVASPLMWEIVSRVPNLSRAVFMVQKEVAERIHAAPGGRNYGALSVWIQSYVQVEWGFEVGPEAFSPPPRVDSAVIAFHPLPPEEKQVPADALSRTLKVCFQQRRKQLQSLLRQQGFANSATLLEKLGIDPVARPETLDTKQFHALARTLFPEDAATHTP